MFNDADHAKAAAQLRQRALGQLGEEHLALRALHQIPRRAQIEQFAPVQHGHAGADGLYIVRALRCEHHQAVDGSFSKQGAQAGASLQKLSKAAADHSLTGLEFAAGIPGTVGGAAYMNAGAYGGELKDVVTLVTAMEQSGKTVAYTPAELQMSYRHSRFSDEAVPSAILSVTVALHPGDLETIRATIREFAARRREKQPLSVPGCGSTFKRPEGQFAGTLIDNAGLKGLRIGGASVSTLHAGFLVNDENGTAADYLALIAAVQKAVQEDSGVWLEPEVRILGEDAPVSLL